MTDTWQQVRQWAKCTSKVQYWRTYEWLWINWHDLSMSHGTAYRMTVHWYFIGCVHDGSHKHFLGTSIRAHALSFPQQYATHDQDFLECSDETWVHQSTPELKHASMNFPDSPWTRKFKAMPLVFKVMTTLFWDQGGVLLVDFLEGGPTINESVYGATHWNVYQMSSSLSADKRHVAPLW